jgi:hypothetical protein
MHLMKIRVTEKSNSKKWSSAEAKAKAMELEQSWNELKAKHEKQKPSTRSLDTQRKESKGLSHLIGFTPPRGASPKIASRVDSAGVGAKAETKVYTGEQVIGISIVHKSCLQPVFSEEQAKDFANMRR